MSLMENEWFIQAPWGRIGIIAWGNCYDPPVLLCHGMADCAVSFRPLVSRLPKNYYYIGIELPGNGVSDPFPPGLMISIYDVVYSVQAVVKHFRWKSFVYIGHSFGAVLGKIYNVCYPGTISKLVAIDPINFYAVEPEDFAKWYGYYFVEFYKNYDKYNMPKEKSSKLKWTEALASIRQKRPLLSEEQAAAVLKRLSEPAGDGLISKSAKMTPLCLMESSQWSPRVLDTILTARAMQHGDQLYDGLMREWICWRETERNKGSVRFNADSEHVIYTFSRLHNKIHRIPFPKETMKTILTAVKTPTVTIVCKDSLDKKLFRHSEYLLDGSNYPNNNYRCVSVEGGHDVHISNPERLASFIKEFLARGVRGIDCKSKLYTFDRRQTKIYGPPFSRQHVKAIYTAVKNPILTMATEESLKDRLFRNTDFLLDESNYPNKNFRCVSIKGGHDVHISNPERLAPFINEFLGKGVDGIDSKAKL